MNEKFDFYDQSALIHRLSAALKKRSQQVVFVLGAALSEPMSTGAPGVFGTNRLIEQIRSEFVGDDCQLGQFDQAILNAGDRRYQAAFVFLQGRLGQASANEIVRNAVFRSRFVSRPDAQEEASLKDDELRILEADSYWCLNPGTASVGRLVAHYPERFGRLLLTTNFDPLIEIGVGMAGGQCFKTFLHSDGNISQTDGPGCHVVHLHGYWYGCDTLHTTRQLQQPRPHLKASLASLLRARLIVICGYGGWDDVFTNALMEVVRDDSASPEILWCFYATAPTIGEHLVGRIAPGVDRGRVSLYAGIDCNAFFPALYQAWTKIEEPSTPVQVRASSSPVRVRAALREQFDAAALGPKMLPGDDEDRPPLFEFCVGRDSELKTLEESSASVVFVTGPGGQGKSTLTAQYFAHSQAAHKFAHFIWRDCKEESERFEAQLAFVVEALSGNTISGHDLAREDVRSIVELLMSLTKNVNVLFAFDNADHYVNHESCRMTAGADVFIQAMLGSESKSRILFTCRLPVRYDHHASLSFNLEGLSLEATEQLFKSRNAASTSEEIAEAHHLTGGHAFGLDLLSIQVTKQENVTLRELTERIRVETGPLPVRTLNSLWTTLNEREQQVLRCMAEAVRPETEDEIAEYLRSRLSSYHKVLKALNSLRKMNLVVVKKRPAAADVLELHPLVRQFIRSRFSQEDRSSFIDEIVKSYKRSIGNNRRLLDKRPSFAVLQYWSQAAELDIAAGSFSAAFLILNEAADAFEVSGFAREYVRVVRLLFATVDWVSDYRKYKGFDHVFRIYVCVLNHLGEWSEVQSLVDRYALTVVEKDVRYINYCDLKCYTNWVRGDFADAVMWGKRGQVLQRSSGVDTDYDGAQHLALAERDAGQPDVALTVFLEGRRLEDVTDPDELDEDKTGEHYGNVGRCLYLMGQVDRALVCYQKSALLLEKDPEDEHILNQGFSRRWIGEVLVAKGQQKLAALFLEAAKLKWEKVSPPRASEIVALQRKFKDQLPQLSISADEVERVVRDWISGREVRIR